MSGDIGSLRGLPVADKLRIVTQLWDDIAASAGENVIPHTLIFFSDFVDFLVLHGPAVAPNRPSAVDQHSTSPAISPWLGLLKIVQ